MSKVVVLEAILKVLCGLEYLKMKEPEASPTFVLLPDFVLLTHQKPSKWTDVPTNGRDMTEQATEVLLDGHAAIGAMTLAMLADKDDGNYQISLVARTSSPGWQQCKYFLTDKVERAGGQPLDLSCVLQDGEARYLQVQYDSKGNPLRKLEHPKKEHDLTWAQYEALGMVEYTSKATLLGVLDLQYKIVDELLERMVIHNKPPIVFADLAAFKDDKDNKDVLNKLKKHGANLDVLSASERDVITFASSLKVSKGASCDTNNAYAAARLLADELRTSVLLHTDSYMVLVGKTSSLIVPAFEIGEPYRPNGAGDTFNAGVMLGMAVRESLTKRLPSCPPELSLSLEECLVFGSAVVAARLSKKEYALKKDLLEFIANAKVKDVSSPPHEVCSLELCSEKIHRLADPSKKATDEELIAAIGSGSLFESIFAIHKMGEYPSLSSVLWERMDQFYPDSHERKVADELKALMCLSSLRKLGIGRVESGKNKLLFADLDHTLFDSLESREKCAERALQELNLQGYLWLWRLIYDDAEQYKGLNFPDFRQNWNTRESYEVLIALAKMLTVTTQKVYKRLKRRSDFGTQIMEKVRQVKKASALEWQISKAQDAFERMLLEPYPDARGFLDTMKKFGAELYLVTEGTDQTQRWKIGALRLSELFPEKRIMCTEATMDPTIIRDNLTRRRDQIEKSLNRLSDKIWERVSSLCAQVRNLDPQQASNMVSVFVRHAQRMVNGRNHYQKELRYIDTEEKVLRLDLRPEKHTEFYARCIIGMSRDMDNPVRGSKDISELKEAVKQFNESGRQPVLYIASIGDRPQVDANPLRSLCPNIQAVRLKMRKGKYTKEPDGPLTLQPNFVARSLTEALCYLARPATWSNNSVTQLHWEPIKGLSPETEQILHEAERTSDYPEIRLAALHILGLIEPKSNP